MFPNRTICDTLEAMRECYKTRNFSYIMGLIEEAQNMANRMEASLEDKNDCEMYLKQKKQLSDEVDKLKEEVKKLEKEKDENPAGN